MSANWAGIIAHMAKQDMPFIAWHDPDWSSWWADPGCSASVSWAAAWDTDAISAVELQGTVIGAAIAGVAVAAAPVACTRARTSIRHKPTARRSR